MDKEAQETLQGFLETGLTRLASEIITLSGQEAEYPEVIRLTGLEDEIMACDNADRREVLKQEIEKLEACIREKYQQAGEHREA